MITAVNSHWREFYSAEVEKSIKTANEFNAHAECRTRQMTPEEYENVFGAKRESCHKLKIKNRSDANMKTTRTILIDTISKIKRFIKIMLDLKYEVDVRSDRFIVDGRSFMGLFSLDLSKPVQLVIHEDDYEIVKGLLSEFEVTE